MDTKVSVIVPVYNPGAKFKSNLASLDLLLEQVPGSEVIFVDDCSTDGSYELLLSWAEDKDAARALQLDENSGSPSRPRNVGVANARGEYVYFLDADDRILPAGISASIEVADHSGADFVRAPLIRDDGYQQVVMNEIQGWGRYTASEKKRAIVRLQSTTAPALYRTAFLRENNLEWPTDLHMAEDAIFLYQALAKGKVEYSTEPEFVYQTALQAGQLSSTQKYGDAEMRNHTRAWRRSSALLEKIDVDFFKVRGQVALQAAINSLIRNNRSGVSPEAFDGLSELLNEHHDAVSNYSFNPRFAEVRDAMLEGDLDRFHETIKLRLLVAGYDLKFVRPAFEVFEKFYQVKVDEWTGHHQHNETASEALLGWADVIWCEWMLGNAVWYSQRKRPHQALVVRIHRFEVNRDYGFDVEIDNVDRFITIAPAILEDVQRRFAFPREKMLFMPNYLDLDAYQTDGGVDRQFNLAMVGSLPKLKGLHRALELLLDLKRRDDRYHLTIYGKSPEEVPWIVRNPEEMEYYRGCRDFIEHNDLADAVEFGGWVDTHTALANVGFVLSMSDVEGSHVAATEGFAAGGISVFHPWNGVEFLYPDKYVFGEISAMAEFIWKCREEDVFENERVEGIRVVERLYGRQNFELDVLRNLPAPTRV